MQLPIIVTGRPRCGSTLICEQLYRHPGIRGTGELFTYDDNIVKMHEARGHFHRRIVGETVNHLLHKDDDDASSYLDYLQAFCRYKKQILLFKLLDFQSPGAWKWALRRQPYMIYVRRDNPLEAFVSMRYAQATGMWHVYDEQTACQARQAQALIGPLKLDKLEVLKELREDEKFHAKLEHQFRGRMEIPYSYLCRDFAGAMQEVWHYLGLNVPDGGLEKPRQVKIDNLLLSQKIENYGELASYFDGTRYEKFIPSLQF